MTTSIDTIDLKRRMHGAVEALKHDLGGLRTGRASTALLDPVHVEVYGANMPLNQVATVSVPEAADAVGPGVGPLQCPAGRKSDPQRRPWHQPDYRRPDHPPADPRADRGAPQGAGQARRPICREGADRGPQRPPRRHGPSQDRREEARDQRGRAQAARASRCRS